MEDSGVPVQDDWSMAPDEDRVRFSLSGVTPLCKTTSAAVRKEVTTPHNQTHKATTSGDTHTHLLLVHGEFVATGLRFTAGLLILFLRKHRGILGK